MREVGISDVTSKDAKTLKRELTKKDPYHKAIFDAACAIWYGTHSGILAEDMYYETQYSSGKCAFRHRPSGWAFLVDGAAGWQAFSDQVENRVRAARLAE